RRSYPASIQSPLIPVQAGIPGRMARPILLPWVPACTGTSGAERVKRSSTPHLLRRRAHGPDDVLIAGAAAEIGRQHLDKVGVADVRLALEHADGQHQEAGRTEAALQAVVIHERLLQGMQPV